MILTKFIDLLSKSIIPVNGANRLSLIKHGLQDKIIESNSAGADPGKRVVDASLCDALVAGDAGPLGARISRRTVDEIKHAWIWI